MNLERLKITDLEPGRFFYIRSTTGNKNKFLKMRTYYGFIDVTTKKKADVLSIGRSRELIPIDESEALKALAKIYRVSEHSLLMEEVVYRLLTA